MSRNFLFFFFFFVYFSLQLTVAQDVFYTGGLDSDRTSFSSWSHNGDSWKHSEGFSVPLVGVRPAQTALSELQIRWQPVTIDPLAEFATIRGQLIRVVNESGELSPINWQQGVTVAISRESSRDLKAGRPVVLTSDQSVIMTCLTNGQGAFEVKAKLADLMREKEVVQQFPCSLAMAVHSDRQGLGPIVVWSSVDRILEHSIVLLAFPANPTIDPVVEAIRVACGEDFNPKSMILAVNALQPLGKEAALRRLEEFLTESEKVDPPFLDADGLFWILRLLFEPIELDKRIPPPMAFVRTVDSTVEANWPLNPIIVIADIPFQFVGGFAGGSGMPESPRSHIEFVRRYCVIRDFQLHPSRDPILIAQQLIESPLVSKMPTRDRKEATNDIRSQAMMLLPYDRLASLPKAMNDQVWNTVLELSKASSLTWRQGIGFQEAQN
ncbi:MAG: hypothetical protein KDB03_24700 [Planctomycetales bacterium]|nr:hypothetical protein [Planctomycetales bacterium]